jgi:hypothetical protein
MVDVGRACVCMFEGDLGKHFWMQVVGRLFWAAVETALLLGVLRSGILGITSGTITGLAA